MPKWKRAVALKGDGCDIVWPAWYDMQLPSCRAGYRVATYIRTSASADTFLGVPFNVASTAFLTHMIAQQTDLEVGEFIHVMGDTHLYLNHLTDDIVYEHLKRESRPLPQLRIKRKPESIHDYKFEDFEIVDYDPQPHIPAPVAV